MVFNGCKKGQKMDDRELNEKVARKLGWIDYPTDSIECGGYWHKDAARAPFGERINKNYWNPCKDVVQAYQIASDNGMWLYFGETASSVDFKGVLTETSHQKHGAGAAMCRLICEAFVKEIA